MNKISRKGFLKIAAAAAMSGVTAGALAACNAASSSTAASAGAAGSYTPGTYTGTAEGISSTVKVTMTFSDSAVTDVVVDTSGETASYGAAAAEELKNQLLNAGSDEIDGVQQLVLQLLGSSSAVGSGLAGGIDHNVGHSTVREGHGDLDGRGNALSSAGVGTGGVAACCTGGSGGGGACSVAGSQCTGGDTGHGSGSGDLQKAFTRDLVHAWMILSSLFLFLFFDFPSYPKRTATIRRKLRSIIN